MIFEGLNRPAGIACGKDCVGAFQRDSQVTLTQAADRGSHLAGWSGDGGSGTQDCAVTLSGPREVTATTGSDEVGDDCTAGCRYPPGTVVTLDASPPEGTSSTWSGCTRLEGRPDTCTVTMDRNRRVSVSFPSSNSAAAPSAAP